MFKNDKEKLFSILKNMNLKEITWSTDQEEALRVFETGVNCYLMGAAGTGKSTLIKYFAEKKLTEGKKILECAPTGLATSNFTCHNTPNEMIGTIHQVFKPKIDYRVLNKNIQWMANIVKDYISKFDIVIIDENPISQ